MKKTFILLSLLFAFSGVAQTPETISYQAVVRTANNELVPNTHLGMRVSLLHLHPNGNVVYQETYDPKPVTNMNGLVSLEIGSGTALTGDFKAIDWSSGPYYIKVETDPKGGTDYSISGTSPLLTVPYAKYADKAGMVETASILADADGDTKVEVEKNANENIIRFSTQGMEHFNMDNGRLGVNNTGNSVFVGTGAGAHDDLSDNNNTLIGHEAGYANTTGSFNVASGYQAMMTNTTGYANTASGAQALYSNTAGLFNTAIGAQAMTRNTTGSSNVAVGIRALYNNTTQSHLVAVGDSALFYNQAGANTALGSKALYTNTTGVANTATGYHAMYSNAIGNENTASGFNALYSNTTGNANTATGVRALYSNTTGGANTASGLEALQYNTTGSKNTANGYRALAVNKTGSYNTATGYAALSSNTSGARNVAIGSDALYKNTTGINNVAIGHESLTSNKTGTQNTATGFRSLSSNTKGNFNVANGFYSLYSNVAGEKNVALGSYTLYENTNGNNNTATGNQALRLNSTGHNNTASGFQALGNNTIGIYNTAIGHSAHSTCSRCINSTGIGYNANPVSTNGVHVGNSSVTWIGGQVPWAIYSDGRIKTDVKEDVSGLDFITRLRPVTYHIDKDTEDRLMGTVDSSDYAEKYDIEKIKMSGFIAQEVEQAAREAGYDFSGITKPKGDRDLYSLSYAQFVVPLVKAVQEQQQIIQSQNAMLKALMEDSARQKKKLESLITELHTLKVSLHPVD